MSSPNDPNYFAATRHPLPCLLFVLPLLLGYEACVLSLGGEHPEVLRNGADNWLRMGLAALGVSQSWVPPALLLVVFAGWCYVRRGARPVELVGTLSGMGIESVAYALGLWGLGWLLTPLLQNAGLDVAADGANSANPVLQIVPYVGAGIYEEALFRLLLFSGLAWLLKRLEVFPFVGPALAALGSATLFATAHHIGPQGQPYSNYLFVFRLVAGIYFAVLFQLRGFGVAVGAHACYNVMVSVSSS
jgi:Type II CAAX prenyl endopeptidase Rce1-like